MIGNHNSIMEICLKFCIHNCRCAFLSVRLVRVVRAYKTFVKISTSTCTEVVYTSSVYTTFLLLKTLIQVVNVLKLVLLLICDPEIM